MEKKMNLIIRNVKITDLEAIVATESRAFDMSEEMTRNDAIGRIENYPDTFLVAEVDSKVVGHIFGPAANVEFIRDEMYFKNHPNHPNDKYQMILSIAVDENYRERGIATALMNEFEKIARQAGRQELSLTCYPKLFSFYEKLGFVNKGKTDDDIPDPDNESSYNMIKILR
ncbi:acetyltransferase [Lactobacillus kalixensis DSM 16043]|uniref:Acetyltransferase n=2 Tax=Lactobacillus kalixensis TaxID=227944 RepID=A0A0R1U7S8_9LACO|nr:acetyltransferase [Lactobacillus kalixensis DSM 16043]